MNVEGRLGLPVIHELLDRLRISVGINYQRGAGVAALVEGEQTHVGMAAKDLDHGTRDLIHSPALGEHVFDAGKTEPEIRKEAIFVEGLLRQKSQLAGGERAAPDA